MRVAVVQKVDGELVGEHEIPPQTPSDSPKATLEKKAASHKARGWKIKWDKGRDGFTATKTYPGYGRKDRHFRLTEG